MEIEVNGHTYALGKLTPREQRHIAKRLAPLLLASKDLIKELYSAARQSQGGNFLAVIGENLDSLADGASPLVAALGAMPDADLDYLIENSLAAVKRKTSAGAWMTVMVGERLQFEDLSMADQIGLTVRMIRLNLGNSMPAFPGTSPAA